MFRACGLKSFKYSSIGQIYQSLSNGSVEKLPVFWENYKKWAKIAAPTGRVNRGGNFF